MVAIRSVDCLLIYLAQLMSCARAGQDAPPTGLVGGSSIALLIQSVDHSLSDPTLQIYYKCTKPSSGAAHQISDYVVQDSAVLIVLNLD